MSPDSGFDRFLDRTIVPGYSSVGYNLRRRRWNGDDPQPGSLVGRRALVTGAGGGLGAATALGLARLGATVHLLVRSPTRAAATVAMITETLAREGREPALHVEECDVSDLTSVRRFADAFVEQSNESGAALDILVHNAGVFPAERSTSIDGHELTVATHVLGPVLMTDLLRPVLRRADEGARVILVASGGMYSQALPVTDPEYLRGPYKGAVAYARSKRMQVDLTPALAQRWAADGVSTYAMHPGWADTPGVASSFPLFRALTRPLLRDSEAGADTVVWLAATWPAPASGKFWHDRAPRPTHYRAGTRSTPAQVETMWQWVQEQLDGA